MNIKLQLPGLMHLQPRITVVGVGGAGSNAVNNMIASGLSGVNFVVANTDSQSLANSSAEHRIQLGAALTEGLGAGARPEIGKAAAEEAVEEIRSHVSRSHMVFVAAGMRGGTGTGAAAVIARVAREAGALTVGVVTKPFQFEGTKRMRAAEAGIAMLKPEVDTLIVIPNQNLFRVANERTTFADAFVMADQVLYSGIACVVDLIVKEGLINLDFADVRTVMSGMGTAMMGTGEASGDRRATIAAEEAISNPLLDDISLRGARGLLVSITGSRNLTLYEVDEAATRVRQEVDAEANIIVGATFDDTLGDKVRVSIVASGMERMSEMAVAARQAEAAAAAAAAAAHAQPTVIDTQPPYLEPYPSAYGPHETVQHVQPALEPASSQAPILMQPEAHAHYAPSHHQQPIQAEPLASLRASAMPATLRDPRGMPGDPELTRALSDALTHRDPGPQQALSHGGWTAPGGAVFEDASPQPPMPAPWQPIGHSPSGSKGFPQATSHLGRPNADAASGRRMPDVDDFPMIGQREYHAKMGQYGNPPQAAPPPRAYAHPAPEPAPKRGFFARLFRRKPAPQPAPPSTPGYPHAQPAGLARREHLQSGTAETAGSAHQKSQGKDQEHYDLPVFFGSSQK